MQLDDYCRIFFDMGKVRLCKMKDLFIEKNSFLNKKPRTCFEYFKFLKDRVSIRPDIRVLNIK